MRINIKQVLKNYRGEDMVSIEEGNKERPLFVRDAINSAINGIVVGADGKPLPLKPEEKGRIYQLSTKIWDAKKEVKFTPEEVAFIKERAGKVANISPLICGRICDLLEGKKEEGKEK